MRFSDMHVHSTFSSDGKSSMNEHCEIAIQKNLKSICFTEHVDLNDKEINLGKTIDKSSQLFNIDEYFNEIDNMRKKYPKLKILSGIEFSEPHIFYDEFIKYSNYSFDCIIGSIHHCFNNVFPGAANISEEQAIYEYYELMIRTIKQCEFQVLAHLDFPKRYFDEWNIPSNIIDEILRLMIEKNIILEINTSSANKNDGFLMPELDVLMRYQKLGGKKIVLSSDAHVSSNLACCFQDTFNKLPNCISIGHIEKREFIEDVKKI